MPQPTTKSTPIQVINYDPNWPQMFGQLRDQIWPAVSDVAIEIEHVGSTSVPGMAAKPIIDIDLVLASHSDLPLLVQRLEGLSYKHFGNLDIEDRDAFIRPNGRVDHHLYACLQHSLALQNHLAIRNYLRTHPSEVAAYSALKKQLAEIFRDERPRYVEGKTEFLLSVLERCGFSAEQLDSIRRANRR
jgi:GrpB-like predicted nucleotidyltransferase (UPF0157 family)